MDDALADLLARSAVVRMAIKFEAHAARHALTSSEKAKAHRDYFEGASDLMEILNEEKAREAEHT